MTKYYALYPQMEDDLRYCRKLARINDGLPERYDPTVDDWVNDPEMFIIYTGEVSCDEITEKQADYVIDRIKSGAAEKLAYEGWKKAVKAGKYKAYGLQPDFFETVGEPTD